MIWTAHVTKIDVLLEFLKSLDKNLKFTVEIGEFIDFIITIDDNKPLTPV